MKKFLSLAVALLTTFTAFAGTKSVAEDVTPKSIKIGTDSYVQVTSAPDDWSGEYIIVANVGGKDLIWNGLDAGQNGIEAADTVAVVTVAKSTDGYSMQLNNGKNAGKYVAVSGYNNGLKFNAGAFDLKLAFKDGAVEISRTYDSGTMYLLYNKISGVSNERFRFYKGTNLGGDNYLTPALYKKVAPVINYYLVGTLAENGWDETKASPMAGDSIVRSVAAGTYEFKVLPTLGSWDGALGYSDVVDSISSKGYENNGGNVKVTLNEDGTVKVFVKNGKIGVVGDFGKATVTVYTIAGVTTLTGSNWDPTAAANDMTENDGVWTLVKSNVTLTAGSYDYKMVGNHAWGVSDVPASGNNTLKIAEDAIYDVTFTFNSKDGSLNAAAVKVADIPAPVTQVIADGDYLIANVEGGYVGGGNDWGTHATNINKPQWFTVALANGKYTLDSHQSNGGNNHYLSGGLYVDSSADGWDIQPADESNTTFTIRINDKYLSAKDGLNKPLSLVTEEELGTASSHLWKFITLDDVKASMDEASAYWSVDVTALIKDPELKRNGNTSGFWTITGFDGTGTPKNFAQGQGGNTASCGESFHSANGFKAVQTITLPKAGVYTLSAQAFYRQDDGVEEALPYLFAGENKSNFPAKTGAEDNMVQAYESFLAGIYPVEPVRFVASEDGQTIEIGVAGEANHIWNIFGELSLLYYGAEPVEFTVTPAAGTIDTLLIIKMAGDDVVTVADGAKVVLYGNQTTIATFDAETLKQSFDETKTIIYLSLPEKVGAAGMYMLDIPAGAFTIGGKPNTAQMINWTIEAAPAPASDFVPTAVNLTSTGGTVTFATWPSIKDGDEVTCDVVDKDNNVVSTATISYAVDYNDIAIAFNPELAAGTYTINVNGKVFDNENEASLLNTLEFTVEAPAPAIALADGYTAITSADELEGWEVVLMNVDNGEYVFGKDAQNIGTSADFATASSSKNSAPSFRIVKDALGYKFVALTPAGENYNIWGACPSYINSQPNDGGVSFILNDNNSKEGYVGGQDLNNGAIWTCEYNSEKAAFTIKNVGSGLYLNGSTVTSAPAYYVIAHKTEATNGIATISAASAENGKYMENGKIVIIRNGVKYNVAGQTIK